MNVPRRKPKPAWSCPSVLVAIEKHEIRYLDATSEAALHRSALRLLAERFDDGYFYHDPSDDDPGPKVDLDEEGLRHLAADSPMHKLHRQQVRAKAEWLAWRRQHADWYASAQASLAGQDGELAWRCLQERSDGEYEGVSLEPIEGFISEETSQ